MGILDDLLGSALGGVPTQHGSGQRPAQPPAASGGTSGIMMALLPVVLSMLANRGGGGGSQTGGSQTGGSQTGGGLGDLLGQMLGGATRGGSGAPQGGGGGLGDLLGQVLGGGARSGGAQSGLGGLIEQMQRAGLGDQAQSWVGRGQNMPISPDQLGQLFGERGVDEIARQAGVTPEQASQGLSELLPEVVDHLTPDGQVPAFDQLTQSVDSMARRLRG